MRKQADRVLELLVPLPIPVMAALAGVAALYPAASLSAHPGGLNAEGCHTNRKTGEYHCHRPQSGTRQPPQRRQPAADYYPNCAAVRAAGRAPLRRGEPGYRAGLDRDDDGIACET